LKYTGYYKYIAHMYMLGQKPYIWDSRLLLHCTWDLCSSVLLLIVGWFVTDVSGQQCTPYSRVKKAKQNLRHLYIWYFTNIRLQSGIIS